MQFLIGKKIGMTRIFDDAGKSISVTVVQAGGNIVHQVKTIDKDGYSAVQLGFEEAEERKFNKPELGHFKKLGTTPTKVLKEFSLEKSDVQFTSGQKIGLEIFDEIKFVDVTGTTKGRGHTGTIKRYNFQRGRKSHGNTNYRERGSSGANTYPARVFPGLRMSGHYGNEQVTIKNIGVAAIDKENDLIYLRGAVPGCNKGIVFISKTKQS
jgi:large subunit ribosomal protein L3